MAKYSRTRSNDDRPSKIVAPNIAAATAERINIYSGSDGRVKVGSPQRNANTCAFANMVTAHAFYEVFNTSRDNTPVVKIFASKCPFKLYRISPVIVPGFRVIRVSRNVVSPEKERKKERRKSASTFSSNTIVGTSGGRWSAFRIVATIFYNLTDFTSDSRRGRSSSIFLNAPMNINTKAAVIYAEPRVNEWRDEGNERKRENEGREKRRKKERFNTRDFHFMSRSVFMPQILAPTRGRLRFLPVESSPIFTIPLPSPLSRSLSLVNEVFSQISRHK